MIPYRVRQVLKRRGRLSEAERAWARAWLSDAEWALFQTQEGSDRRHALDVARALAARGDDDPRLLAAALLHDVGKAPGVPLGYRTVSVLLKRFGARRWLEELSPTQGGWLAPLARSVHHPALGAARAHAAGSDPGVVALIAHHQDEAPSLDGALLPLLHALQAVDDTL